MAGCKQFLLGLTLLSILLPGRMQMAEATGGSTPSACLGITPNWGGLWDSGEQGSAGVPEHTEEGGSIVFIVLIK